MDKKKKKTSKDEELKQKCEEYLSGWKRALADYQNLQKETAQQKASIIQNANLGLILELLPLLDNFKTAFSQVPEKEKDSPWVIGFSYIKKQFTDLLVEYKVEPILTVGQKFNCLEHEAVAHESDQQQEDQIILAENKAGYKLNGKVIQVAKVTVNNLEK